MIYLKAIDMEELKQKLRQFLNEKDMRLEKAAILIDCSVSFLSRFLNSKTNPNERNLYKIKKFLGIL